MNDELISSLSPLSFYFTFVSFHSFISYSFILSFLTLTSLIPPLIPSPIIPLLFPLLSLLFAFLPYYLCCRLKPIRVRWNRLRL